MVGFGFQTYAWSNTWVPPQRAGWRWVPGYYSAWGYWCPGYWAPAPTVVVPMGYQYVPGWWDGDAYIDGYYRQETRDKWEWVEGYYLEDGTFVRGHWRPTGDGPEGYTWEPGFWDGENWIEGFWRPEFRQGYTWLSAYYDEDGIFHAGYWMPTVEERGYIWVPGWFDGNEWQQGYWESEDAYNSADPENWQPEEGWDDGWETGGGVGDGEVIRNGTPDGRGNGSGGQSGGDVPLAMPVWFDNEEDQPDEEALPPM